MSIDLVRAKEHLRVRHDDQDDYITLLISSALAALQRYAGDNFDPDAPDIDAAHLVLIDHLFYPEKPFVMDSYTGWPRPVAALMKPFRNTTLA